MVGLLASASTASASAFASSWQWALCRRRRKHIFCTSPKAICLLSRLRMCRTWYPRLETFQQEGQTMHHKPCVLVLAGLCFGGRFFSIRLRFLSSRLRDSAGLNDGTWSMTGSTKGLARNDMSASPILPVSFWGTDFFADHIGIRFCFVLATQKPSNVKSAKTLLVLQNLETQVPTRGTTESELLGSGYATNGCWPSM